MCNSHSFSKLTPVVVLDVEFFSVHPEWIVDMIIVHVRVDTYIFHVVGEGLFPMQVQVAAGIVGVDVVVVGNSVFLKENKQ